MADNEGEIVVGVPVWDLKILMTVVNRLRSALEEQVKPKVDPEVWESFIEVCDGLSQAAFNAPGDASELPSCDEMPAGHSCANCSPQFEGH